MPNDMAGLSTVYLTTRESCSTMTLDTSQPTSSIAQRMRKFLVALISLSIACPFGATAAAKNISEKNVLAKAREISEADCHGTILGAEILGCDYEVNFMDGQWSVFARMKIRNHDGTTGHHLGMETLYLFKADGTFLRRIEGM